MDADATYGIQQWIQSIVHYFKLNLDDAIEADAMFRTVNG